MAERSLSDSSSNRISKTPQHEGRNVWVLTAYGVSGLALFGVLAYYFSTFLTH